MIGASMDYSALTACFGDIKRRAENWRKPIEQSGPSVLQEFERTFATHGPGWPSNAKGSNALVKTGRLKRSLTQRGAEGNLWQVGAKEGRFGTTVSYASALNAGGAITLPGGAVIVIAARPLVHNPSPGLLKQIGGFCSMHFARLEGTR